MKRSPQPATAGEFETFEVKVPPHVARRVRFAAIEVGQSPGAYIGVATNAGLQGDLESSPAVFDRKADERAIEALNPPAKAPAPGQITIKLTPATMRRLLMVAGESGDSVEAWAADVLGDAVTGVAQTILDNADQDKQRALDKALNVEVSHA